MFNDVHPQVQAIANTIHPEIQLSASKVDYPGVVAKLGDHEHHIPGEMVIKSAWLHVQDELKALVHKADAKVHGEVQ